MIRNIKISADSTEFEKFIDEIFFAMVISKYNADDARLLTMSLPDKGLNIAGNLYEHREPLKLMEFLGLFGIYQLAKVMEGEGIGIEVEATINWDLGNDLH